MQRHSDNHVVRRVFRLRHLPAHVDDRQSVIQILCRSIDSLTAEDVYVSSLANEVDVRASSLTKTATIIFRGDSHFSDMLLASDNAEHTVPVAGLAKPLLIDHHFLGLTPLNHVAEYDHTHK